MVTFEEFEKTVYYTATKIVVPLLHIRLDKVDYMKNGKYLPDKVKGKLLELYETNFKK